MGEASSRKFISTIMWMPVNPFQIPTIRIPQSLTLFTSRCRLSPQCSNTFDFVSGHSNCVSMQQAGLFSKYTMKKFSTMDLNPDAAADPSTQFRLSMIPRGESAKRMGDDRAAQGAQSRAPDRPPQALPRAADGLRDAARLGVLRGSPSHACSKISPRKSGRSNGRGAVQRLVRDSPRASVLDGSAKRVSHYVNGRLVSEKRLKINAPFRVGTAELGNWNGRGFPDNDPAMIRNFSGAMDEFCLFSRALPPSEIRALYSSDKPQSVSGTAR